MSHHEETLRLLHEIVARDHDLARAHTHIAHAERETATALALVKKTVEAKARAAKALSEARAQAAETDAEIARLEARIRKLEDEAGSLVSGEMIRHTQEAIAKHRGQVDQLAEKGLDHLARVQELEADELRARLEHEAAELRLRNHEEIARAVHQAEQGVIDAASNLRSLLLEKLPPEVLDVYESARRKNPDSALCYVEGALCAGCGGLLTTQYVHNVARRNEFAACPHCGRLHDIEAQHDDRK